MSKPVLPATTLSVPLVTRMGIEIPKPKDWQAFQRNCVLLFRDELKDPNAQEFGRGGQGQGGIDVLGYRNGDLNHRVGVQCRLVAKPLKKAKMLKDARDVLALGLDLKELIFATTAPDDVKATKAALEIEREFQAEGHHLRIVVNGWEQMQKLISLHEVAYHAFHPAAVSTSAPIHARQEESAELASIVASKVVEHLRASGLAGSSLETTTAESAEDPLLHGRIDALRDLFKDQALPVPAQKGLELLQAQNLSAKPWAHYRIETILASIELDLGKEKEAARRFRFAFTLRPDNAKAIANLALAQTIDGEYALAMETARKALSASPPEEHAVSVLLQAAARSGWKGQPEELIPPTLRGTVAADFGMADFLRRTEAPGWQARCIELAALHPERREFKIVRATAVLALVVENPGRPAVASEMIAIAAEDLRVIADRYLNIGFAHSHDLMAHVNNAALLLRFSERHKDSEDLLIRGIATCGDDPQLRRLLALAQFSQGRAEAAIGTLGVDADPENILLRAELLSTTGDHKAALVLTESVGEVGLPPRLAKLRRNIIGELALVLSDWPLLDEVIKQIHDDNPDSLVDQLLALRKLRRQTTDRKAVQEAALQLASRADEKVDMPTRFSIASEAYHCDLPAAAADLLEEHVDLHQASPPTFLYLESLANARRDTAFRSALDQTSDDVRKDPRLQWVIGAHAWNRGDLDGALTEIEKLLDKQPHHAAGRLLKIEILMRQDKSAAVFAELDADLERLPWKSSRDEFRLASLLSHFGYVDRAAALAYRLFLKHRDLSPAWMTLSGIVLDIGRERDSDRWRISKIGSDAAVDLQYDDGTKQFFVIEDDVGLRSLDESSWEPSHKLAIAVRGLAKGGAFSGPDGRSGRVANVRHKYVARLHYVLENFEKRFPTIFGVKRIPVDLEKEGGLNRMISELQARRDYIAEEAERYSQGIWALEAFAKRVGADPIDAAQVLVANGRKVKVAIGTVAEQKQARDAVVQNKKQGCVLDLATFWTAHRLRVLDQVKAVCGPVYLPQSVVDRLRLRRERLSDGVAEGVSSGTLINGQFAILKTAPEEVVRARDDLDTALQWIAEGALVRPIELSDSLPGEVREILRKDNSALFDSLILATQKKLLFVSDDLAPRRVAHSMGALGTWLNMVLAEALDARLLSFDAYVRASADLALAGHNFVSVSGDAISYAARLDWGDGQPLGWRTIALAGQLGGISADVASHLNVVARTIGLLWNDDEAKAYRRQVTSEVLRSLTRERIKDCRYILDRVEQAATSLPELHEYILAWRVGHFLSNGNAKS